MFLLFKFLHIVSAIIWIGGAAALIVLNNRLSRMKNNAAIDAFAPQLAFFGRSVLGPAAGATLIAGILSAIFMGVRFNALWILWGFAGILASMVLSAVFIRRVTEALARNSAAPTPNLAEITALQNRLSTLNIVNLVILLSVVAAMVFKPVL